MNAALMKMVKDMLGIDPDQFIAIAQQVQGFGQELVTRLDRIESRLTAIEHGLMRKEDDGRPEDGNGIDRRIPIVGTGTERRPIDGRFNGTGT